MVIHTVFPTSPKHVAFFSFVIYIFCCPQGMSQLIVCILSFLHITSGVVSSGESRAVAQRVIDPPLSSRPGEQYIVILELKDLCKEFNPFSAEYFGQYF